MSGISFIYQTRCGLLHHLTNSNQQTLKIQNLLISGGDFVNLFQGIKHLPIPFTQYIGQSPHVNLHFSILDNYKPKIIEGLSDVTKVRVKTHMGFQTIDNQFYIEMVNIIKPTYVVCLTELPNESKKSYKRSCGKTITWLDELIASQNEKKTQIFYPLHFTAQYDLLSQNIQQIADRNIQGITIIQELGMVQCHEFITVLNKLIEEFIPKEKNIKLSMITQNLTQILIGYLKGIQFVEVEQPFSLSDNGHCLQLVFPSQVQVLQTNDKELGIEELQNFSPTIIDLNNEIYKLDSRQLRSNCHCLCCSQNHTRAYIHHLLNCKEMNAQIYLSLCNIKQYQEFQQYLETNSNQKAKAVRAFITANCPQ